MVLLGVFKYIFRIRVFVCLLILTSYVSYSQSQDELNHNTEIYSPAVCLYQQYKPTLDSFYQIKVLENKSKFKVRSNNDKFELRLYVDTSYERKLTGVYNNNDSVVKYLNKVVDSVKWFFNNASPFWDLDIETDIIFFDTATAFSYGANAVETLINFYNWLDSKKIPGNDDNYVFHSGHYTNQGVSFVGELCFPGVSMVGFVSNFNSNVDLSSHEWIGHSSNSYHYNTEPNIMNSIAQRRWNTESIEVIDSFLDQQNCFINAQAPLSLGFVLNPVSLKENGVELNWSFDKKDELSYFKIERKFGSNNWKWLKVSTTNLNYRDGLEQTGVYQYRIHAYLKNHDHLISPVEAIKFTNNSNISIIGNFLFNPEFKRVRIYDFAGRQIYESRNNRIDLRNIININYAIIRFYVFKMV